MVPLFRGVNLFSTKEFIIVGKYKYTSECTGHTSDTYPYSTSTIMNQHVNGLCNKTLHDFTLTIQEHSIVYHGLKKRRKITGRGVMIILEWELTKAWAQTGKLCPLTSNSSSFFWLDDWNNK